MKWILILALLFCLAPRETRDFTAPFYGAQAVVAGENPYSDAPALAAQMQIYGEPITDGRDQHRVAYPVTSLLLLTPFLALEIEKAALIYRVLAAFLMIFGIYRLQKSLVWALLTVVALHEPIVAFNLGQMALLTAAFSTLAVGLLNDRREVPAVLCMVGASISPVVGIPFALLMLRGRALVLYVTIMLGILVASLVVSGFWLPGWISNLQRYGTYTTQGSWIPAFIPFALVFWFQRHRAERVIGALLLVLPLTGLYQAAFTVAALPRQRVLTAGFLIWGLYIFSHAHIWLIPLIIAAHLVDLRDLRQCLQSAFVASRSRAAALGFQPAGARPASAVSDAGAARRASTEA